MPLSAVTTNELNRCSCPLKVIEAPDEVLGIFDQDKEYHQPSLNKLLTGYKNTNSDYHI